MARIPLDSGRCGPIAVDRVGWVVPGRALDEDHASFVGFLVQNRIAVVAAYDEQDLDTDGKGLITHAWPVKDAPPACQIVTQMLR